MKRVIISFVFVFAISFVSISSVNNQNIGIPSFDLVSIAFAQVSDGGGNDSGGCCGGGGSGGSGGGDRGENKRECYNGATNYPSCNNNQCIPLGTQTQNLACPTGQTGLIVQVRNHTCPLNAWSAWTTISNTCQPIVTTCSNGATNFPYCNVCPEGKYLVNGMCVNIPPTCSNGATNYPLCNNNVCTNGATNFPYCNNNVCTNGATNFPYCNNQCTYQAPQTQVFACEYGQTGSITKTRYHSCPSNIWGDWTITSNTCQNIVHTCSNGATNFPYCNNNTCTNGATNFPACNNNITWCNGIQYYAGYICPVVNQYNLTVSTTGANPLSTSATIYGYVNPYNSNATIWFDYGTNSSWLQYQTTRQNTSIAGQFTASLSNLQCGTRYYYRAVAQNSLETKYGATQSFVTPNCYQTPVYYDNLTVTRLATKVGVNSAQLNGSYINNSGNTSSCVAFFDYGSSVSYLNKRTLTQGLYSSYSTNYFSQAIYGLTPNTTYFYRAGTTCNDGTKFGQIYKFTTGKVVNNYVAPKPITIVADNDDCNCEIPEYMTMTIDAMEGEAAIGKTANYRVIFKNVSESALHNVVVRVVLPEQLSAAGSDRGQFTKGGNTFILTIPMLRALEEGSMILTVDVASGIPVGQQLVVNAYADYTTPTLKKSGTVNKGEVTAYTISVAGNGTSMNPGNNNSVSGYPDWMPQNLLEWLLFIIVLGIFFSALRYLFSSFK